MPDHMTAQDRVKAGIAYMEATVEPVDTERPPDVADLVQGTVREDASQPPPAAADQVAGSGEGITPPPPAVADDHGLAAIARAEARARESYDTQSADLSAKMAEMKAMQAKIAEFEQLQSRFNEDPIAVARELAGGDISAEDLAGRFYSAIPGVEDDGNDLQGLKARLDRVELENKEYQTQAQQRDTERAQMEFQRDYTGKIQSFMGTDETQGNSDLDYVNAYFDTSPKDAMNDMWSFAGKMAGADPNGPLVKPADVAQSLNDHLKRAFGPMVEKLLQGSAPEVITPPAETRPPADNRTLMNSSSVTSQPERQKGLSAQERYARGVAWAKSNIDVD